MSLVSKSTIELKEQELMKLDGGYYDCTPPKPWTPVPSLPIKPTTKPNTGR